ncbi:MAG: hypothetical protein MUD14_22815 [Hydrococcus sp. Prado102]|jgi:hypothetical protein|nr:hypothetical protein [Hydrococcus sp. Prado102]
MVQQPRREDPLYSCIVPIDSITGNADEELTAFGISSEAAANQARQLLAQNYKCDRDRIEQLMQQATINNLAPWCASDPI